MSKTIKPTGIMDRIKDAIEALKGKPHHSMTLGIEVKRCSECEHGDVYKIIECIQKEMEEYPADCFAMYRAGLRKAIHFIERETGKR